MPTCKTCRYWENGICDAVDCRVAEVPQTLFEIEVRVSDDTGLNIKLRTGPDFGCVLHEDKGLVERPG